MWDGMKVSKWENLDFWLEILGQNLKFRMHLAEK